HLPLVGGGATRRGRHRRYQPAAVIGETHPLVERVAQRRNRAQVLGSGRNGIRGYAVQHREMVAAGGGGRSRGGPDRRCDAARSLPPAARAAPSAAPMSVRSLMPLEITTGRPVDATFPIN